MIRHALAAVISAVLTVAASASSSFAQDLTLASKASQASQTGNGMSILTTTPGGRTISADGRYLVFVSGATNLVGGQIDTNGQHDVFLHDRVVGTTTLVSHAAGSAATTANGLSLDPVISADGAFVAFISDATNLVAGSDTNGDFDVFLYERATGTVRLVSHAVGAAGTAANAGSFGPSISGDGAFVAFESLATDLVGGTDANATFDVFLFSRATGTVTLVSHAAGLPGTAGNGSSLGPVLSTNGAFVAFASLGTDLAGSSDTNGASDVFLYERATGAVSLVSHAQGSPGTSGDGASAAPALSTDAGVIAFHSLATNLVAGADANADRDVFLYERATGTVTLVSHVPAAAGTTGNGLSFGPVVSANGAFVAFVSEATDLVAGSDANADFDVFLFERATGTVTLVSHVPGAPGTSGNSGSLRPDVSADGGIIAFDSQATNLVTATDPVGTFDVFRYERATHTATLVSHLPGAPGIAGNHSSGAPTMSADGAVIAFETDATNLLLTATDDNIVGDVLIYKRAPIADLVETGVSNPPASVVPGATFTLNETVLNQGELAAAASTTRYYLSVDQLKTPDDFLLGATRSISSLAAGASSPGSRTLTIPSSMALGTYYVIACADDTKAVGERDEFNNCQSSASPVVVGRPDLVISTIGNPPAAVAPGGNFVASDTTLNQGDAGGGASATRYYLSSVPARNAQSRLLTGMRQIVALGAGVPSSGTATITIPTNVPLATYYLIACADDFLKVLERDETNNCSVAATQLVVSRADLVATDVTSPPAVVLPAGTFAVTDTVVNQGGVAAGPSGTRYYLSTTPTKTSQSRLLSGTRILPGLGPGATSQAAKSVTVPSGTPLATYYFHACADDLRQVVENNETNNCVAAATQVTVSRPDLTVTAVSNPPAIAVRGTSFTMTDTVTNQGLLEAAATMTRFYLSLDGTRNTGDVLMTGSRNVPVIAASGSSAAPSPVTVTIPTSMAAGNYWVLGCADDQARVVEISETNNCRASATKVNVQ